MALMAVTGVVLLVGITLTLWWGGSSYETWERVLDDDVDAQVRLVGARSTALGRNQSCSVIYGALPSHSSLDSGPGPS